MAKEDSLPEKKSKFADWFKSDGPLCRTWKKMVSGLRYFFRSDGPFRYGCKWVYRLRSIFLAVPVAMAAVILAIRNLAKLPDKVGFDLQSTGEFTYLVDKSVAVMAPLAVTALCLLMVFLSKRVAYPWLVSLFSLLLPVVILLVNTFPG